MTNFPPIFARRFLSPVAVPFVLPWNVGRIGCYVEHGRDGNGSSVKILALSALLTVAGLASTVGALVMAPYEWRVVVGCIVVTLIGCWIGWTKWSRIRRSLRHYRTLRFDKDSSYLVLEDRSGTGVRVLSSVPIDDAHLVIHEVFLRVDAGFERGFAATVVCPPERITVLCVNTLHLLEQELESAAPWLGSLRREHESQFRGRGVKRAGAWPREWALPPQADV